MMLDNREIWIRAGYEIFARSGLGGLKVEPLAKVVGKSKSSFYHHFVTMELFIKLLLQHHIEASRSMSDSERQTIFLQS